MKRIIFLSIVLLGLTCFLHSQEDTSLIGSKHNLKAAVKEKIMEKLDVDESTANRILKLFNDQRKAMSEYNKEKRELVKYIENNPGSSDVLTKINELFNLDDKINKTKKDLVTELSSFLTPKQTAQIIVFQKNLRKLFIERKDKLRHR